MILPNHSPPSSPTESKRLFYTSVSLLRYNLADYMLMIIVQVLLSGIPDSHFLTKLFELDLVHVI